MPFVSIHAGMAVSEGKMERLQKEIGRIIALIPGKTIDNTMTKIEGGAQMFMSGKPAKAVFCELRLFGAAPKESKVEVVAELNKLLVEELGAEKVYINFQEFFEWGNGSTYQG